MILNGVKFETICPRHCESNTIRHKNKGNWRLKRVSETKISWLYKLISGALKRRAFISITFLRFLFYLIFFSLRSEKTFLQCDDQKKGTMTHKKNSPFHNDKLSSMFSISVCVYCFIFNITADTSARCLQMWHSKPVLCCCPTKALRIFVSQKKNIQAHEKPCANPSHPKIARIIEINPVFWHDSK